MSSMSASHFPRGDSASNCLRPRRCSSNTLAWSAFTYRRIEKAVWLSFLLAFVIEGRLLHLFFGDVPVYRAVFVRPFGERRAGARPLREFFHCGRVGLRRHEPSHCDAVRPDRDRPEPLVEEVGLHPESDDVALHELAS